MRREKNKLVWISLALLLLISGIRFDSFERNPAFVYAAAETESVYFSAGDHTAVNERVCTAKMLGIHEYEGNVQQRIRLNNQKRIFKVFPEFFCPQVFSLREGRIYSGSAQIHCKASIHEEAVANYIHKSDGKKRNHLV